MKVVTIVFVGGWVAVLVAVTTNPARAEWPTYHGNPAHTGYVPGSLDPNTLSLGWNRRFDAEQLDHIIVAEGRVFLTDYGVFALDCNDGTIVWSNEFARRGDRIDPPGYGEGRLYVRVRLSSSRPQVYALDADTGDILFRSSHEAQFQEYYSPVVYEGTVYVCGGDGSGVYAYDADNGDELWYRLTSDADQWTPSVNDRYVVAYGQELTGDYRPGLFVLDRPTGAELFMILDPNGPEYADRLQMSPVLSEPNHVIAVEGQRLICFDIAARVIAWEQSHGFAGQPSVANGCVYVIDNGILSVHAEADGQCLWSWTAEAELLAGEIIVTDSHILVSTADQVHALDIGSHESVWSYPVGGSLVLSDGVIYITSEQSDGMHILALSPDAHLRPNIQARIDAAIDGEVITLEPGIYSGPGNHDIDFKGKRITLTSIDPNNPDIVASTIVDCLDLSRGFHFHNGEGSDSMIRGLTIRNGYGFNGAGIFCEQSSPHIVNCRIMNCWTEHHAAAIDCIVSNALIEGCLIEDNISHYGEAAGIYTYQSNVVVDRCIIRGNSTQAWRGGGVSFKESGGVIKRCLIEENLGLSPGGGIRILQGEDVHVTDCELLSNIGGGLYAEASSNLQVSACLIADNIQDEAGGGLRLWGGSTYVRDCIIRDNRSHGTLAGGGGLYLREGAIVSENCEIRQNWAKTRGGGVLVEYPDAVEIVGCEFLGNSAEIGGGGFALRDDSVVQLRYCTFTGNSAIEGASVFCDARDPLRAGNAMINNCILWDTEDGVANPDGGNVAITYSDVMGGWPGEGNIDADPCFVGIPYQQELAGTVSHWKLDEGQGNDVYDSITENHGIVYGATWQEGRIGSSLFFDGNDYVAAPLTDRLTLNGNCSLSAWIKTTNTDQVYGSILALRDSVESRQYYQMHQAHDYILFSVYAYHQASTQVQISRTHATEQWYHLAAVHDGNEVRISANGDMWKIGTVNTKEVSVDTLLIGGARPSTGAVVDFFEGAIDDVRVFDRALSASEIQMLSQNTLPLDGDIHILAVSPCIDTGDPNTPIELNATDLDGDPRIVGPRVDMGVDEFRLSIADLSANGTVDFEDFVFLMAQWGSACEPDAWCDGSDIDLSGFVDIHDLQMFVAEWLTPRVR